MYKKITHTIVEEHFDCPEAVDIASEVNSDDLLMPMMRNRRPRQNEIISQSQLRSEIQTFFNNLSVNLDTLASASFDDNVDFSAAMDAVFSNDIDRLGNFLRTYYGAEFAARLNQDFRSIAMNLMYLWRAQRMKIDQSNQERNLTTLLAPAVGILFGTFNNIWDRTVVTDTFTSLIEDYMNLGTAKLKKDVTLESNIKSSIAATYNDIVNTMTDGLIAQKPEFFTA